MNIYPILILKSPHLNCQSCSTQNRDKMPSYTSPESHLEWVWGSVTTLYQQFWLLKPIVNFGYWSQKEFWATNCSLLSTHRIPSYYCLLRRWVITSGHKTQNVKYKYLYLMKPWHTVQAFKYMLCKTYIWNSLLQHQQSNMVMLFYIRKENNVFHKKGY